MKKTLAFLLFWLFILSSLYGADIDFSGRIKLFSSVFLSRNLEGEYFSHEEGEFAYKRLETRLQLGGNLSDNISYFMRFDAFSHPDALFSVDTFPQSSILGTPSEAEPFETSLYEGYLKASDFLFQGLDLSVGKQRVQWGTADKVNVVDNLNPVDFANFFTFDPDYFAERRPQTALNLEYYISEVSKLQFVWLLSRQHAPLPAGFSEMISSGANVSQLYVEKDEPLIENTNLGIRFSTVLFNTDLALSYYKGNFPLPVLYGVSLGGAEGNDHHYKYPEKNVFGLELSGEIYSIGFWAEGAYVRPEKIKAFVDIPVFSAGQVQFVRQKYPLFAEGYFKYVLGFDYTLGVGNGIYLNAQFLHGFFDERDYSSEYEEIFGYRSGMFFGEIEDYIIARAEYKMLNGDLKIEFGEMIEFADKGTAVSFLPSLEYRALDHLIFQAGAFFVTGGEQNTKFGTFKEDKLFYFTFKINF